MTTDPSPPSEYALQARAALSPPALPDVSGILRDQQNIALGESVRLITEAHQAYSRSGMTRPFFDFVRIVLTTKEER